MIVQQVVQQLQGLKQSHQLILPVLLILALLNSVLVILWSVEIRWYKYNYNPLNTVQTQLLLVGALATALNAGTSAGSGSTVTFSADNGALKVTFDDSW